MPLFGSPGIEKLKAKRDIKGLSLALKHENQIVRRTAARALGEIGDARAIEPLIAALEDEEWAMRQAVAEALDRLGWQPDGGRAEAVYWATKQQWDKCAKVGAPAMDPLIAVLRGELKNMHAAAAEALGKVASLTDDVRAVEPLIAKLRDSDICVRQAAAEALGRIGDIRAIEPLIGILEDEEWRVRAAAAKALGKVASLTGDTRAVEPLVAKLKDGDSDTRRAAAGALDELGWQPSQDENGAIYWVIRGECYRCVGIGPLAVEPLITALRGSDRRLRQAAAGALGEIGDTRAFEPLIVALRDRIPLVRYEAAKALSKVGGEKAIQPLLSALTYEDTQMCEVAIRAIEAIGSSEAVRPLRALLRRRTFGRDVNLIINEVLERLEGLYGQSASIVLGIDLGTSHSVCSVIARGEPVIIPSAEGDRLIPSVVATDLKTGERLVGRAAERQAVTNSENTIFSVKRFMGNKFNDPEVRRIAGHVPYEIGAAPNGDVRVWMGGKVYSPPEISAMILQKLRKDAEAYIGKEIARAVITVPAYFDDSQRQATRDAGRIAGLKVLRIINESTAAALAYGLDKKHDETIAVYHLGGGTFDISILEIGDGVFDVRSTHGDNFLGGDDWDQRIIDYVAGRFQKSHSIDLRKDTQALQRLKEASEKAKIELSTVEVTEIDLPFITTDVAGPKHLRMRLTRPNLEKLTMDLLERTIDSCKLALEEANLKPGQVHNVILVGGMTRMPAVQQKVTSFFSKAPHKGVNPDEVVGIGAGIQAGVFSGRIDDVLLLDVTPLTLGIETEDGKAASVIERNTTIPTRKSHICTTARDNQAQVDIHVIQGEHSEAAQNKSLGKFIFGGIQPASRGVPKIEVVFDIDADGVLNVVAKDKDTGRKQSMQVVPFSGLTEKEVERMTQEARHYYEQDLRKKRKVELRNDADNTLYAAEKLLQEQGDGMSLHLRHGIESRVERLKKALVNGDTDLVRQCIDKLSYALLQVQSAADQDVIYL